MQSFLVRLSYKNKYINTNNYYEWSKKLEEIGKYQGMDKIMPKRVNNIFKENITFTKLLEAHNKCKKNKRFKKQVIKFEMKLESNLIQIGKESLNNTYTFSEYFEFIIYEPKERKIKTLNYKDRVVQTWYVENFLKPYFKPNFINDNYACI